MKRVNYRQQRLQREQKRKDRQALKLERRAPKTESVDGQPAPLDVTVDDGAPADKPDAVPSA